MDTRFHQHDVLGIITAVAVMVFVGADFWTGLSIALICNMASGILKMQGQVDSNNRS